MLRQGHAGQQSLNVIFKSLGIPQISLEKGDLNFTGTQDFSLILPRVHIPTWSSFHFSFWPGSTQNIYIFIYIFMYKMSNEGRKQTGSDWSLHLLWVSPINLWIFLVGTILSWLQFTSQYYCMADVWLMFEQAIKYMWLSLTLCSKISLLHWEERKRRRRNPHFPWHCVMHLNCGPSSWLVRWIFKHSSYWTAYKILSLALNKSKSKPHSLQNKMWENTYCADTYCTVLPTAVAIIKESSIWNSNKN